MTPTPAPKPRLFIDADVLFAGAASPNEHSASLVLLRMAEITLIEAVTSQQVITEVTRNLEAKMPAALPAFHLLVKRSLRVVPDPTIDELDNFPPCANPKDLPIIAAAAREACTFLATYNTRHYQPGLPGLSVQKPGDLLLKIRYWLARLDSFDETL